MSKPTFQEELDELGHLIFHGLSRFCEVLTMSIAALHACGIEIEP